MFEEIKFNCNEITKWEGFLKKNILKNPIIFKHVEVIDRNRIRHLDKFPTSAIIDDLKRGRPNKSIEIIEKSDDDPLHISLDSIIPVTSVIPVIPEPLKINLEKIGNRKLFKSDRSEWIQTFSVEEHNFNILHPDEEFVEKLKIKDFLQFKKPASIHFIPELIFPEKTEDIPGHFLPSDSKLSNEEVQQVIKNISFSRLELQKPTYQLPEEFNIKRHKILQRHITIQWLFEIITPNDETKFSLRLFYPKEISSEGRSKPKGKLLICVCKEEDCDKVDEEARESMNNPYSVPKMRKLRLLKKRGRNPCVLKVIPEKEKSEIIFHSEGVEFIPCEKKQFMEIGFHVDSNNSNKICQGLIKFFLLERKFERQLNESLHMSVWVNEKCSKKYTQTTKTQNEKNIPKDIFIIHAKEDAHHVLCLINELEKHNYSTWHYNHDSLSVIPYLTQESLAIEKSKVVALFISKHSLKSPEVEAEVHCAHRNRKPLITLLLSVNYDKINEEWKMMIGRYAAIPVPPGGISKILPRILGGLTKHVSESNIDAV